MSYRRVLPRDLFNEAKLLKCLGQLSLLLHDGVATAKWPLILVKEEPAGFTIEQDPGSGELYCTNLKLMLHGREIELRGKFNSREAYPLIYLDWAGGEGQVFDDEGNLAEEFTVWLDGAVRKRRAVVTS